MEDLCQEWKVKLIEKVWWLDVTDPEAPYFTTESMRMRIGDGQITTRRTCQNWYRDVATSTTKSFQTFFGEFFSEYPTTGGHPLLLEWRLKKLVILFISKRQTSCKPCH